MSLTDDGVQVDATSDALTLDWGFWDAQLEAIEAIDAGDADVVVFRGGYGSGKSILGARQSIEKALAVAGADVLILAQDASKGGPTTYKVFFEQLPGEDTVPERGGDAENSPIVADHNKNDSRLTLTNGSVIRLGSADKWNRYAGGEFNFIWADEVGHYENTDLFKLNRMLISRQRTNEGPNVTLWTSTGNGYNQFYDFVELQETPDGDPLTTNITNVVADSRNNPFLAEKEKLTRQFEGTSAEEQGLAGGFAASEGLVYSTFSRNTHVISDEQAREKSRHDWRMYGYDAGWDDPRVVVEIARSAFDQYIIRDVFYESETTIEDVVDPGGGGWMDGRESGTVYCEHEPAHIEKFKRAGWRAEKADKSLDEGIPAVRERLRVDEDDRPGLLVAESCSEVVEEFLSYKEEQVGKSSAQDHALDAIRYALFTHEGGSDEVLSFQL